ncbi:MAG: penicillin-binding protein activator [Gammaproteobacteria bacterium]|nr:penicillin-binding protein activator [Gammaproteobacteria bacterium]MBU1653874.1 penicillin-binding protein activator [Gammaproteobacteria bacterium]MBU1962586.1 penicillin-binding protein activator [Gammaproteobacteria bacterium]
MHQRSLKSFVFALFALLTAAACVPTSTTRQGQGGGDLVGSEERQRYLTEAMALMRLAKDSPSPARDQQYMKAAELFLYTDRPTQAIDAAGQVNASVLPAADQFRWRLLSAEIDLQRGAVDRAVAGLEAGPDSDAPRDQLLRYYQVKAKSCHRAGKMLESARARTALDRLLEAPDERTANQLEIVKTLALLSDTALDLLQPNPPDEMTGWMELARIFKKHGDNFASAQPEYAAWRARFPSHPAETELFARHYGEVKARPRTNLARVAVLLPQSGPLQKVANSIREGIMAAHSVSDPASRPGLSFYDSSDSQNVPALYQQAVQEGASAVIGPLDKGALGVLAAGGDLPVPTLALNQNAATTSLPPANLYQFALSPEDEARQAAERARQDGHALALAMAPNTAWGQRELSAFTQRWTELGGRIAEQALYDEKQHDFSPQIVGLTNLDEGEQRYKRLQKLLGRNLHFEPQPRRDADFLFLSAEGGKAREIRPQLQFHRAGKLAIYSTSRVFNGDVNPGRDRDIDGVRFPDVPWLLVPEQGPLSREAVARMFPASQTQYPRLYAMGIDSYNLLFDLERLAAGRRHETSQGKTGNLYLDEGNLVHRRLVWAEISNGRPKVIGYTPAPGPGVAGATSN